MVFQRRRCNAGSDERREAVRIYVFHGFYAIVDASDAGRVAKFDWYLKPGVQTVYAGTHSSKIGTSQRLMHRLIIGAKPGEIVDHINGDGLDNRRTNLRIVTAAENAANRFDYPRNDRNRGGEELRPTPFQQRPNGADVRAKRLRRMRRAEKRAQEVAALKAV